MRVLVIYAHPLADSLAAALHGAIIGTRQRGGHQVDDCDLYAEGFDPVLSASERRAYNTPQAPISGVSPRTSRGCERQRRWCCVSRPGGTGCRRSSRVISTGSGLSVAIALTAEKLDHHSQIFNVYNR